MNLSAAGVLNGSPSFSGSAQITVQVQDAAAGLSSALAQINILSENKISRPAYNTGTGYFVDSGGLLRDPSGYLFTMRGLDRVHYNSDSWAGPASGALAYPNAVRVFMFDGQTAAFAANQVQTEYAPNNIFTVLTLAGISGTTTTGDTNPTTITNAVNAWISYLSALSPVMNSITINIANEWGPANSTVWRDTYITAVGSLRSAGYTCPLMIDAGGSGEDLFNITSYAAAINSADPQQNCIFSIHPYEAALPWQGIIQSVTKGNPTVLTLNSNWADFPLNPGASAAGNNNYNFEYQITGAQGLTQLNGIFASDNKTYGSQNNWQAHLSVDSTLWSGNYTPNSAAIYIATNPASRNVDYRYLCSLLSGLGSSGVCAIIGEFGPGNQSGNPLTPSNQLNGQQVAPSQLISACEAYGVSWIPWAWDDHSGTNTTFVPDYFNMVLATGPGYGTYTANSQLTAYGLSIVANPRIGLWARSQPAASYLTVNPINQPLLQPSAITYLGTFLAPGSSFANGGNAVSVSQDTGGGTYPDGQLYLSGNLGNNLGIISIPTRAQIQQGATGAFVTAAAVVAPVTIPYTYTTGTLTQPHMGSSLVWNGRLIYQQFSSYSSAPTNTHGAIALNLSDGASGQLFPGSNTVANMGPLTGTTQLGLRHVDQFMGVIPPEWRTLLGGPCLTGASIESTFSTGGVTGVSAYVFDPANVPGEGVTGLNPIPMNCCLDYFYSSSDPAGWKYSLGGTTPQLGWLTTFLEPATISTSGVLSGTLPAGNYIVTGSVGVGSVITSGGDSFQTVAGAPIGATVTALLTGTGLPGSPSTWQLSQNPASAVSGNVYIGNLDNGYCGQADRYCGIIFPSKTRTVAFVGRHGNGAQNYKNPNDNPGGNGASPYSLRLLMFDATQFINVLGGTAYPWGPTSGAPTVPYATLDLTAPAAAQLQLTLGGLSNFSSCYYDDTPLNGNASRIYYVDNQAPTHVHVWEVSH